MIRRLSGYLVFTPLMLGVCTIILLMTPSVASANITPGTPLNWCITVCGLGDSGTLTGFFELGSNGAVTNWNLTTTDGSVTGSNYTPADNGPSFYPQIIGGSYAFSDQISAGLTFGTTPLFNGGLLTLIVDCKGVANCLAQASAGQFFTLTGATETYTTWSCSDPTNCTPSTAAPRSLDVSGGAFINVTDPVGGLALNLDTTSMGTAWTPGGGGTGVPEPSTLLLSALGFAALALKRFYA